MTTKQILIRENDMGWTNGSAIMGDKCLYEGKELAYFKILSDKRKEGKGITYLLKFVPPKGKMIKTVAKARSEENVYIIKGDMRDKRGEIKMTEGDYALNETGHPHSQFVMDESVALVVCSGDIDEIIDFGVVDIEHGV
ncbi:MAG: cupin domain-containing protein [bacterium]